MPDIKVSQDMVEEDPGTTARQSRGREREVEGLDAFEDQGLRRPTSMTPVTVVLLIIFIISAVVLIGVLSLPVLRDYFQGEGTFWFLRVGLLAMIASVLIYFVLRERSNIKYAERLFDRTTEANRRLRLMLQAERDIGSSLDLEGALDQTLQYAFKVTNADMGAVYHWRKGDNCLVLAFAGGLDWQQMKARRIAIGEGLPGRAAADRLLTVVDDALDLSGQDNVFAGAASPSSQIIVPLVAGARLVGILVAGHSEPHDYSEGEKEMLEGLRELAGMSITKAELYRIARKSLDAATRQRGVAGQVLDGMEAGVVAADREGQIFIFNREAQHLTGYSFEEVANARLEAGVPPERSHLGPLEQVMLKALGSPTSVDEGEAVMVKKDGSPLSIHYRMNAMVEGSNVVCVTAVFMEEKEPSREIPQKEELGSHAVLRSLGSRIERLYTQPLSHLIEQVRLMDIDDWTHSRDDMVRVLKAGEGALTGLLEDVEQFLNCIVTREWDRPELWEIGSLVAETIEKVLRAPETEGVVVAVTFEGPLQAYGHERMIRTALEKVIENACSAAALGRKKVEVSGFAKDGISRVEVKDTGPGIPDQFGESIFQPFVTTRKGHSGLGLAIVERVMFGLGGRVGVVESREGATFFLEFPVPPEAGATPQGGALKTSER